MLPSPLLPFDPLRLLEEALTGGRRFLRLVWGPRLGPRLDAAILVQRARLEEAVCGPSVLRIDGFTALPALPVGELVGLPFALEIDTRSGTRVVPGLVAEASTGLGDGGLTGVRLVARDPFHVLAQRRRLRVWNDVTVPELVGQVFGEWLTGTPLGRAFTFTWLDRSDADAEPRRAAFVQHRHESDAAFVQRLLRSAGFAWCWRPEAPRPSPAEGALPRMELLLWRGDGSGLPDDGPMRYRVDHGVDDVDALDSLSLSWRLAPGSVTLRSWDHEQARVDAHTEPVVDAHPGEPADALAAAIVDTRVVEPHLADTWDHLARLAGQQADSHRYGAHGIRGEGTVADLRPGTRRSIENHPAFADATSEGRSCTVIRTEAIFVNNLPADLEAHLGHLPQPDDADEALPRWAAAGSPADARAESPRQRVRFLAVRVDTPVVPSYLPARDDPRPDMLTGIVRTPNGEEVWCDALGRVRVELVGAEPGSGTLLVRARTPLAGASHGFSFVLRNGTEVDLEPLGGPDRLVIAGAHFNGADLPPRVAHQPSLPANRHRTALVTREIGGHAQQHLQFDDTPGEQMMQLATDAGATALSLGALTTARHEGRAEARGNGFDLATGESGAIHTARSLLLSAWRRVADGPQLSAAEHLALMQDALALVERLGRYAADHHGLAVDTDATAALLDDVKAAPAGSNVDPRGVGGAPTISISAPAGIAATTPKSILHAAGDDLDAVAQRHLQQTAGQRFTVNAGQGVGLFAHHGGLRAIAHHGPMLLQSQHDDTRIESAGDIALAAQGRITLMADRIDIVSNGATISLAEMLTLMSKGVVATKGSAFPHSGPDSKALELPSFASGDTSQRFVLRLGGRDGPVAAGQAYEIRMTDGSVRTGRSDANGTTELLEREAMHIASIRIFRRDGAG